MNGVERPPNPLDATDDARAELRSSGVEFGITMGLRPAIITGVAVDLKQR
jgi:hypothetical protein